VLQLSATPHLLTFKRPARTSRGDLATRPIWLVRAYDSENPTSVGVGECGPVAGLSPDGQVDYATTINKICAAVNRGIAVEMLDLRPLPALAFAIESALLDLAHGARQLLFDTPFTRRETSLPTHGLIWMDDVEGMARQIEGKVAQGFNVIKLKVGALPLEQECALLAELRRRRPTITLRLDANGAFAGTVRQVLQLLERLALYDVHFLEQPIPPGNWPALAEICRHSPIPIALDEELIGVVEPAAQERLLETIRPQHLILKPTLLGGFSVCQHYLLLCEKYRCEWWANSLLESNIGLNAICQWVSNFADGRVHGLGTGQLFVENFPAPVRLERARLVYQEP
jgi:L-alanine-DL-glutamate epimerase-like enolase superfamily enzyme